MEKVAVDNLDEYVKYNLDFLALDTVGNLPTTFTYKLFHRIYFLVSEQKRGQGPGVSL